MSFVQRGRDETLASHLLRNAIALGLTAGQRRRLIEAYRLCLDVRTNADQTEGRRIANEVREELNAAVQAVVITAEQRKEKVTAFNDAGAVQVVGRDGVATLARTKSLTDGEARTAIAYRYLFEHASAGLRSQLGAIEEGGSKRPAAGITARSAMQLHGAYVLARLDQVERAVLADQVNGLELAVLRLVAGHGVALSTVATGSKSKALYLATLRRALASAAVAIHAPLANRCPVGA
jgi:hypothetical protein